MVIYSVMPLAGGQGGPEFGSSVNPIPTTGADYAHHITACPPRFEILTASLLFSAKVQNKVTRE